MPDAWYADFGMHETYILESILIACMCTCWGSRRMLTQWAHYILDIIWPPIYFIFIYFSQFGSEYFDYTFHYFSSSYHFRRDELYSSYRRSAAAFDFGIFNFSIAFATFCFSPGKSADEVTIDAAATTCHFEYLPPSPVARRQLIFAHSLAMPCMSRCFRRLGL